MNIVKPALILISTILLMAAPEAPKATQPAKADASIPSPIPVIRRLQSLRECPESVQASVKRDGHEARVTEIRRLESAGMVLWAFETGTEEGGMDQETNVFYRDDGTLERTESDISIKEAPEAVRQKLTELAGKTAVVDDVEKVVAGDRTTYKAELESNGDTDRKVTLSVAGEVLSLTEEDDD